ncbi:hypothetical protein ACIA8C_19440 [Nocardia sp. NPDC051321]|uniref:hypothetical protein n=1 Tax=Nocardia sp. NPDC051321 TaxID=3364323 RepID=UPI0037B5DE55
MTKQRTHGWSIVLGGVLSGPVAGGQLVLQAKPFGGLIGVPGAVIGYVAVTGLALAWLLVPLAVWLLRRISRARMAGVCALCAGAALITAGSVETRAIFVAAVLIAAAATGPLLVLGRAAAPMLGRRGGAYWCAVMVAGVVPAAAAAARWAAQPGLGLLLTGVATAASGAAVLTSVPRALAGESTSGAGHVEWRVLIAYAAAGWAVGAAVLPGLHLMLFRWNVLDAGQAGWLLLAALPAALAVSVPDPDAAATPVLLTLAAGGPVLVATAPGPVTLSAGLAVTLAAAARATSGLDQITIASAPHVARVAVGARTTAAVTAGGIAGLGVVAAVGRYTGTGSGLTVAAACALATVLLTRQRAAADLGMSPVLGTVFERGA